MPQSTSYKIQDLDCLTFEFNPPQSTTPFHSHHHHRHRQLTTQNNHNTNDNNTNISIHTNAPRNPCFSSISTNTTTNHTLTVLPVGAHDGSSHKRMYVWNGNRLKAMSEEEIQSLVLSVKENNSSNNSSNNGSSGSGSDSRSDNNNKNSSTNTINTSTTMMMMNNPFHKAHHSMTQHLSRWLHDMHAAFFPNPNNVTPDYWNYVHWRGCHRFFSSMSSIFATQSLLLAVGVGAKRSLPAAATINWVLKDGLGRLGRLTVATRFGESFDSDLKRFRFASSLLYACALSLDYLTPIFPQHFLPMASIANIGKSVGLTTYISTQPAFHRSFARNENLADISAKAQAQQMAVDTVGLACAVMLTALCRNSSSARRALPLVAFPFLVTGDLFSIYHELRSIHLRTLNKERAEILAMHWVKEKKVLTPDEVSQRERLVIPPHLTMGVLPLRIGSLDEVLMSQRDVDRFIDEQQHSNSNSSGGNGRYNNKKKGKYGSSGSNNKYAFSITMPTSNNTNSSRSSITTISSITDSTTTTTNNNNRFIMDASAWNDLKTVFYESLPWVSSEKCRGAVHASLKKDATSDDILHVILRAAHARHTLLSSPSPSVSSSVSLLSSQHNNDGDTNDSSNNTIINNTDGNNTDREMILLVESGTAAGRDLDMFIKDINDAGWQIQPFMLSSAEKKFYC